MKNKIYDSQETLLAGLEAEKATVTEYTGYLNLAKQAGNESEVKLWEHIIKDEEEHIKEFENALKGDFTMIQDASPKGAGLKLANWDLEDFENYNKQYENGDFRGSEATPYNMNAIKKWLSIRESLSYCDDERTPGEWEALDIKKFHSKYGTNYIFIEPKQKLWRVSQTGDEFYNGPAKRYKFDDVTIISMKSPEQVQKEQERDENFSDAINDCLVDGGIDYKVFRITNEDKDFYVDFDSDEADAKKAYELLREGLFKCNYVEDDGFYYVHVVRR